MTVRILAVAESDSSACSGLQADIKTIQALGGYAVTAVTQIVAHDANDIVAVEPLRPAFIAEQMEAGLRAVNVNGIKIGFLDSVAAVDAVAGVLDRYKNAVLPVVVDPSVVARSGRVLVDEHAVAEWKRRLYIHASVLTPNLREAELLAGMSITNMDTMLHAADMMRTLGVENIVLKARQMSAGKEVYVVATDSEERVYECDTLNTKNTLGAGSTFSSALTVGLAEGMDVFQAVERALAFLHRAMASAEAKACHLPGAMHHGFNVNGGEEYKAMPAVFYKL